MDCLHDNKRLHENFNNVCSSMVVKLGDHGFDNPSQYITDRSFHNAEFNDEPKSLFSEMSYFQTNLISVYRIMVVESMFGGTEKMHIANVYSITSFCTNFWSDIMECCWIQALITFCLH